MLVGRSSLSKDASGKDLSDGWAVNFAVGCTHGCLFCYVDRIWRLHARNPLSPLRGAELGEWGQYLYVPGDLEERIRRTPWRRWSGARVLMSSTHDPYLPELYWPNKWPRRILEAALPHGSGSPCSRAPCCPCRTSTCTRGTGGRCSLWPRYRRWTTGSPAPPSPGPRLPAQGSPC